MTKRPLSDAISTDRKAFAASTTIACSKPGPARVSQRDPRHLPARLAEMIATMARAPTGWRELIELDDERLRWAFTASVDDHRLRRTALVPALLDALQRDHRSRVKAWAAHTLGRIGGVAVTAIPALVEALESDDVLVVTSSLIALSDLDAMNDAQRRRAASMAVFCERDGQCTTSANQRVRCDTCGRVNNPVVREAVAMHVRTSAASRRTEGDRTRSGRLPFRDGPPHTTRAAH